MQGWPGEHCLLHVCPTLTSLQHLGPLPARARKCAMCSQMDPPDRHGAMTANMPRVLVCTEARLGFVDGPAALLLAAVEAVASTPFAMLRRNFCAPCATIPLARR